MTPQDIVLLAITAWRENRGGLSTGMQSVANVINNRAVKTGKSVYDICTAHEQFSSISMPGPEAYLWPVENDSQWQDALQIAQQAAAGTLDDLTNGSTLYYAPKAIQTTVTITLPDGSTIPFPKGWNAAAVTFQATICGQVFFTE